MQQHTITTTTTASNTTPQTPMKPQTSGWATGHSVMSALLMIWSIFPFVYHVILLLVWFVKGIYGYAVSDLMLLFVAVFMFVVALTGMIGLWSNIHPEHKSRIVNFNYLGCVWGLGLGPSCMSFYG
ncbi:hypothetical protein FDP41_012431 [Naegleria fowleri]|uniref:Uncharacterized protein n=1 Tax=Naegleria fowleri TaxID=5763 RepID=A0A6A5C5M7_NAEFO|nr:uncharacterized protein FDP41_012431 [Naegleria fowleri]KAF0981774.1 hypothetical protein FDP41_012431 [Naegleria fowleri]